MFGEKSQAVAKRFEPFKSILDFGSYAYTGLLALGLTGAAMIAWFTDSLAWAWEAFGIGGAVFTSLLVFVLLQITLRLSRGLFNSWRGAVGLVLIAVGIVLLVSGALILAQDKFPQKGQHSLNATPQTADGAATSRPVFESLSGGKIAGDNMKVAGQLPQGFARAEGHGEISMKGSTYNVVPPAQNAAVVAFTPPDGTYTKLSNREMSRHLQATAKEFRERTNQTDWVTTAIKARALCSEALVRIKRIEDAGPGGQFILMIYVPDNAAANESAKFLEFLSEAVAKI